MQDTERNQFYTYISLGAFTCTRCTVPLHKIAVLSPYVTFEHVLVCQSARYFIQLRILAVAFAKSDQEIHCPMYSFASNVDCSVNSAAPDHTHTCVA